MFKHVNYLESTDGFIVRFVDDAIMGYEEGERKLQFQIEVISRPLGYAIYAKSIKNWDPLYESVEINVHKRNQIINNIEEAFKFAGYRVELDE